MSDKTLKPYSLEQVAVDVNSRAGKLTGKKTSTLVLGTGQLQAPIPATVREGRRDGGTEREREGERERGSEREGGGLSERKRGRVGRGSCRNPPHQGGVISKLLISYISWDRGETPPPSLLLSTFELSGRKT